MRALGRSLSSPMQRRFAKQANSREGRWGKRQSHMAAVAGRVALCAMCAKGRGKAGRACLPPLTHACIVCRHAPCRPYRKGKNIRCKP